MLFADLQCWFTVKPEKKKKKRVFQCITLTLYSEIVLNGVQI